MGGPPDRPFDSTIEEAQSAARYQSLVDRVSANSAGGPGGGSVTSTELSVVSANAATADAALSAAINVVSNALSQLQSVHDVLSNRVSANSATGGTASATSNKVSLAIAVETSNRISADDVLSARMSDILSAVSLVSAVSGAGTAVGLQSVINALSNRISIASAAVTSVEVHASAASAAATSADAHAATASAAATSADAHAAAASAAATSVLAYISAASARTTAGLSVHGLQSVFDAFSSRISASGGVASATSNEVSVAIAVETSNRISADNVLSGQISVLSQQVSVISQQVSVISQQVSVLSQQVSVISQQVSVLSQTVSALSAGLGTVQLRVVTGSQALTVSVFTNVSGISVSVGAGGKYEIHAMVMATVSAAGGGATWGFTYPAGAGIVTGVMEMATGTSVLIAGTGDAYAIALAQRGYINQAAMSTVATAQLSVTYGTSAQPYLLRCDGLLVMSAGASGTLQLQVKSGATPIAIQVLAGSFIRAFKIG